MNSLHIKQHQYHIPCMVKVANALESISNLACIIILKRQQNECIL